MSCAENSPAVLWSPNLPYQSAVRAGELIFVSGQADPSALGESLDVPILRQAEIAVGRLQNALSGHGADLADVVKVVIFYRSDAIAESTLLTWLGTQFSQDSPPALASVPLPALSHAGQSIEIECIAMRGEDGRYLPRQISNPPEHWLSPFSHGLRCQQNIFVGTQMPLNSAGDVVAPGDLVSQAKHNIENLDKVLAGLECPRQAVCRINTFYEGSGTAEDWKRAGEVRGNAFDWPGPVGTGVPVPVLTPPGCTQRQEAFAMLGHDGQLLERNAMRPDGHWDWPSKVNFQQVVRVGNLVYVGGQVSAEGKGKVKHANDWQAQTHEIMRNIEVCLAGVGASLRDVVKLNTFYANTHDPARWHEYLALTADYLHAPGPATTVTPLEKIAIEGLELEIEAYAWVVD